MFDIIESTDYSKLTYFFAENELEIEPGQERSETVINCWECNDNEGNLIAAAALEKRDGEFVVADIAVDSKYRGQGIAKELMQIVETEIIKHSGKQAWLVGKVPDFYFKLGWESVSRNEAPDISKCFQCVKFGISCKPEIMKKYF